MKSMPLTFAAGALALSATALAGTGHMAMSGNAHEANASGNDPGVLLVQRNVYMPVDAQGNTGDSMTVVERQVYIPADQLQDFSSSSGSSSSGSLSSSSSGTVSSGSSGTVSSGSTASTPTAVFVLVPDDTDTAKADGERHWRARKLDQTARNDMRCSNISAASGPECTTYSGTGAAAAGSTQGQSGR